MPMKKRPNAYANRTCKGCRETKKRCNMPASSLLQLPSDKSVDPCQRCEELNLCCVLNDFSKKSRIELLRRQRNMPLQVAPEQKLSSSKQVEELGSQLLLMELVRQVNLSSTEEKQCARGKLKAASMDDLDGLIDDQVCQNLSWWSHNELRLWFPSLQTPSQLRLIRHHSSTLSPASILLESGQYYIAANHLSLLGDEAKKIIEIAEPLIKTSLAEVMLSSNHSDDTLLALQLVSFFQVSGSLSLPMLSASTKAAHLAMLSSTSINKKLAWCSASVWEACIALGTENGVQLFRPEECPTLAFMDELSASVDGEDVAVRAILVRGRSLAHFSEAWQKMSSSQSVGISLASWNEVHKTTKQLIEKLDILQQPFINIEWDVANTMIRGRGLSVMLGTTDIARIASLTSTDEMLTFIQQRKHQTGLMMVDGLVGTTHHCYREAAQGLLLKLSHVGPSQGVGAVVKRVAGSIPTMHGLGYIYEAAMVVLQAHAPILDWMARESSEVNMHIVTSLLQTILQTEEGQSCHLGNMCAQVERDFIFRDTTLVN